MGLLANLVGRTIGLALVWFVVAALTIVATDAVASHDFARVLGWGVGFLAVAWMCRHWHRRGGEIDRETHERALAAAKQLRRDDPSAYRRLLTEAKELPATTDRDLHVGRILIAPAPSRYYPWDTATDAQLATVKRLTAELENATLVRSLDDGATELLGLKDDVAYRYRIEADGLGTLTSTDDSKVRMLGWMRRSMVTGFLLIIGSIVVAFIVHSHGRIAGLLLPFMIVGFVLAFAGAALGEGPRQFLEAGERWQEEGKGWSDD